MERTKSSGTHDYRFKAYRLAQIRRFFEIPEKHFFENRNFETCRLVEVHVVDEQSGDPLGGVTIKISGQNAATKQVTARFVF